jgi:hypothetical protein
VTDNLAGSALTNEQLAARVRADAPNPCTWPVRYQKITTEDIEDMDSPQPGEAATFMRPADKI